MEKFNIYLTGDVHGKLDLQKLHRFKKKIKEEDNNILIILGDIGMFFLPDEDPQPLIDIYNSFPWITLFVDGNHENFNMLEQLPEQEKFGGKVGYVSDKIFHLKRGEYYSINDKTFWVMGGGLSIDKYRRVEGVSWWRQEQPTYEELDYGFGNLKKNKNKVDYILTHTAPQDMVEALYYNQYNPKFGDPLSKSLMWVQNNVEYGKWYCGHYHQDFSVRSDFRILYDSIEKIS